MRPKDQRPAPPVAPIVAALFGGKLPAHDATREETARQMAAFVDAVRQAAAEPKRRRR